MAMPNSLLEIINGYNLNYGIAKQHITNSVDGTIDVQKVIEDILWDNLSMSPPVSKQEKLQYIETLVFDILEGIRSDLSFIDAKPYLILAGEIVGLGAILAFKEHAETTDSMERLISDFDRSFEDSILKSIYNDIMKRTYLAHLRNNQSK
jgi:hypothetical protein